MYSPSLSHVLVFDSATEMLSVGLKTPKGQWIIEEVGGARASARIIAAIHELLANADCTLAELDAIGFGCGPGAFTGLRCASAVAQGLAYGASKPVLALDTLMAVAQDAHTHFTHLAPEQIPTHFDIWVAMDARMDEIYAAHYLWPAPDITGTWHTQQAPQLMTVEAFNQAWQAAPALYIAGSALAVMGPRLPLDGTMQCPLALPRAQALLSLAEQAWRQGSTRAAQDALPVYVRNQVALTVEQREQQLKKNITP